MISSAQRQQQHTTAWQLQAGHWSVRSTAAQHARQGGTWCGAAPSRKPTLPQLLSTLRSARGPDTLPRPCAQHTRTCHVTRWRSCSARRNLGGRGNLARLSRRRARCQHRGTKRGRACHQRNRSSPSDTQSCAFSQNAWGFAFSINRSECSVPHKGTGVVRSTNPHAVGAQLGGGGSGVHADNMCEGSAEWVVPACSSVDTRHARLSTHATHVGAPPYRHALQG
jgi:hypothetical protein